MSASKENGNERLIDITALEQVLQKFSEKRDWGKFHSPKNLAMALIVEAGELVELFQWLTEAESKHVMDDTQLATEIRYELADVMLYLIRLSSVLGVDMDAAVREKLVINGGKYPPTVPNSDE
jgi:dCTP diphosphatase